MSSVVDTSGQPGDGDPLVVTLAIAEAEIMIALRGEIDISTIARLDEVLDDAVRRRPRRLIIDVGELDFLGVVGLRAIAIAVRDLKLSGGQVVLRHPTRVVLRLLEMTGLVDRVCIEPGAAPQGGRRRLSAVR